METKIFATCTTVLVSLLLILSLSACGILKGYVYDKHYHASWVQIIPGYTTEQCEKVGKSETCDPIYHPGTTIYHPQSWELDINSCQSAQQSSNCETNAVTVSQDKYNSSYIGEYVDLSNQ